MFGGVVAVVEPVMVYDVVVLRLDMGLIIFVVRTRRRKKQFTLSTPSDYLTISELITIVMIQVLDQVRNRVNRVIKAGQDVVYVRYCGKLPGVSNPYAHR